MLVFKILAMVRMADELGCKGKRAEAYCGSFNAYVMSLIALMMELAVDKVGVLQCDGKNSTVSDMRSLDVEGM